MNWKSPVRIGWQDIVGIGDGQCLGRQPIREIFTMDREKFGIDRYVTHGLADLSEFDCYECDVLMDALIKERRLNLFENFMCNGKCNRKG